jgi:hypothetical protein
MQIDDATRQATAPDTERDDRMSSMAVSGAEVGTAADGQTKAERLRQMDAVVERNNLWQAYERVMRNKGAAGVDGLTVGEFKAWLKQHPGVARIARKVRDERVLKRVRRYLEAGTMSDGVVSARTEGTPQGGPLSPLLSNILLTDRLKIADSSLKRLKNKVREIVLGNVSRSLVATIHERNPVLRDWTSYFRLTEIKCVAGLGRVDPTQTSLPAMAAMEVSSHSSQEAPSQRTRRKACVEIGKQRTWLMVERWGEHMNAVYLKSSFGALGLVSLLDTRQRFQLVCGTACTVV